MFQKSSKILFLSILLATLTFFGGLACSGNNSDDFLLFPSIVTIDSINNRVFVIDNMLNGLNLINPANNSVVVGNDNNAILDDNDPQLLPNFPTNGAVAPLNSGLSRLFIIGSSAGANNLITALDYDNTNGITLTSFSPIAVGSALNDTLTGIAVDSAAGLVFVTNSTTANLYFYNVLTGIEDPNSPIPVGVIPGSIQFDPSINMLVITDAGSNSVSLINTLDLTQPPQTFDVGLPTRDAALATNASGTILFVSGLNQNIAEVFNMDLTNLVNSTAIFSLSPPTPSDPIPNPNFLTGTLNQIAAGNLSNGEMAGFYTQSSGDLLVLDLTSDLTTLTPTIVTIGAVTGEGIDVWLNSSNQAQTVYFASPGVGALSIVDPLTNSFTDQIQ